MSARILLAALVAASAAAAAPALAASLRPLGTLSGPVVTLGDLFDGVGPVASQVLGPAPPLGGRIVVEAAQLDAIARQFGVAFHTASPADRTVLDRPGQTLARDAVMAPLREALAEAGVAPASEIELPGFAPPLVDDAAAARASVTGVSYDREQGRFSAVLSVTGAAMDPVNMRISGRAMETQEVLVAAHRLAAGDVLRAADRRPVRLRSASLPGPVVRSAAEAEGMTSRRATQAGQPLALADLQRPAAVAKGATVQLLLEAPGLSLTAQGRALESAAIGDRVRVQNPGSRSVVEGEVIGDGRVRVSPAAAAETALR
jgi:flagella basal body P-ring formation protein FlgA